MSNCRFCTTIQLYVKTVVGTVPVPWNLSFANTNYLGQTGYWNMQQVRKWRMFQYFVRMAVSFIIEFNLDAIRGVSLGERILGSSPKLNLDVMPLCASEVKPLVTLSNTSSPYFPCPPAVGRPFQRPLHCFGHTRQLADPRAHLRGEPWPQHPVGLEQRLRANLCDSQRTKLHCDFSLNNIASDAFVNL